MRLVFAGTPQTAVPSLEALLDSRHEVLGVLTRPDAPTGRGRHSAPSPVRVRAQQAGVPVLTPNSARDTDLWQALRQWAPDACPVVAYGALLPVELLQIPARGWINLHFSLLPAWRGAAPVQRAIWAGEQMTGATTFVIEQGLDTGPVLGTLTEPVRPRDTAGELLDRLAQAGAGLLVATMDALDEGSLTPVPQSSVGVSQAAKLTTREARVDWHRPAYAVDRQIRACTPAPGAWTTFRGQRLKVLPVDLPQERSEPEQGPGAPGALIVTKHAVHVRTGRGTVRFDEVQPQGKAVMAALAWARGARPHREELLGEDPVG